MLMSEAMALTISKLRYYSVGIVAENKLPSSMVIEVSPMEETPFLDGEISTTTENQTSSGTNADGVGASTTVVTSAAVSATWLPFCASNRLTAPDVRRGEKVMIYQYGDADQYFWTTLANDHKLRRLETVIFGFSGNASNDKANDASNMYFLEVSTHRKVIHFHTSKANGEPYSYDIQIDTAAGKFTITDDIGNHMFLDSAEHRLYMENVDGSIMDIHRENITNTAPKVIKNICEDFIVVASNKMDVAATNKFTVNTTASDIAAKSTATMTAINTTVSGSQSLSASGAGAGFSAAGGAMAIKAPGSMNIQSSSTQVI